MTSTIRTTRSDSTAAAAAAVSTANAAAAVEVSDADRVTLHLARLSLHRDGDGDGKSGGDGTSTTAAYEELNDLDKATLHLARLSLHGEDVRFDGSVGSVGNADDGDGTGSGGRCGDGDDADAFSVSLPVERLRWTAKSVQGRAFQNEDAHIGRIVRTVAGESRALFAVFDGHGGRAAAEFCAEHFVSFVTKQPEFHHQRTSDASAPSQPAAIKLDEQVGGAGAGGVGQVTASGAGDGNGASSDDEVAAPAPAPANDGNSSVGTGGGCVARPGPGGGDGGGGGGGSGGGSPGEPRQGEVHHRRDPRMSIGARRGAAGRPTSVARALAHAFSQCDEAFMAHDRRKGGASPMPQGCAALAVVVEADRLTVANAGDCRAVLSRRRRPLALSRDHRPQMLEERERIVGAGARIAGPGGRYCMLPQRDIGLTLSRSIGDWRFKECNEAIVSVPDVITLALAPGDHFVVLACDGLWDHLSNEDVVDFVHKRLDRECTRTPEVLQKIVDALVLHAIIRGSNDNVTAVVVLLHGHNNDGEEGKEEAAEEEE